MRTATDARLIIRPDSIIVNFSTLDTWCLINNSSETVEVCNSNFVVIVGIVGVAVNVLIQLSTVKRNYIFASNNSGIFVFLGLLLLFLGMCMSVLFCFVFDFWAKWQYRFSFEEDFEWESRRPIAKKKGYTETETRGYLSCNILNIYCYYVSVYRCEVHNDKNYIFSAPEDISPFMRYKWFHC